MSFLAESYYFVELVSDYCAKLPRASEALFISDNNFLQCYVNGILVTPTNLSTNPNAISYA
jgi:hypothetical protein